MIALALVVALAQPACPAWHPGDTYPATLLQGCPAPVSGLLYGLTHEEADAQATAALLGARIAIVDLQVVAREHAEELHPLVYIASGVVLGAGVAWVALSMPGAVP